MNEAIKPIAGNFEGKDIVSMNQFELPDIEELVAEADSMAKMVQD